MYRYTDAFSSFSANGLAPFKEGDKVGYIDEKGDIVIEPQFEFFWERFDVEGLKERERLEMNLMLMSSKRGR